MQFIPSWHTLFKGALDKYYIIPNFFQKKKKKKVGIFIAFEVLAWVMLHAEFYVLD